METVAVVVSEILGFLAIAWILGFFVAWAIFRPTLLGYQREYEEYEESVHYLKSIVRNQEKEITKLTREVKELSDPLRSSKEFLEMQKKKHTSNNKLSQSKREFLKSENRKLKEIAATLAKIN